MRKIDKYFFTDILRAVFISILLSFALILVLAILVKAFSFSDAVIAPINSGIKTFCILIGALVGIKHRNSGLVKGFLSGIIYILLSFVIFALLDGGFSDAKLSVFDVLLGAVAGVISGVIKVNIKEKA